MSDSKIKKLELDVGDGIRKARSSWDFSGPAVPAFDEHVRRSIPLYDSGHDLVCSLSEFFVRQGSTCYELGSSTGTLTRRLASHHAHRKGVRCIGIDLEPDMVAAARKQASAENNAAEFIVGDVTTAAFEPADLIVAYYTLQFVPPGKRADLLSRIRQALNPGGAFICFEKVRADNARFQDYLSAAYTDFKLQQGYSPEEILSKSQSLKSVLEPFSTEENLELFASAGFEEMLTIQKYICFEGFLCVR